MDHNNNINTGKSQHPESDYMKNVNNSEFNIHKYQQTKELEQNDDEYDDDTAFGGASNTISNANLQKKRVSFSAALHDVVPASETVNSTSHHYGHHHYGDADDDEGDEYEDDDHRKNMMKRSHIPTFHMPITKLTPQTPEDEQHPGSDELYGTQSQQHQQPSNLVSLLTFLETRRRSHAFSISAIDETLQMDMDYDDEEHHSDAFNQNNNSSRFLSDFNTFQNNKNKLFRHAEIPTSDHNRILLSKQNNDVLELKKFRSEVRAIKDVASFLEDPKVALDIDKTCVEEVIDEMLQLFSQALKPEVLSEARNQLFAARDAGYSLANIVQNLYHTDTGQFLHDPTWFCTYAEMSQLKTRRIAIARLKNKTNFGPTLRSVEFVILVLVPVNEKASKNAEQVALSFASLFTDSTLRKKLSCVFDEKEFIQELCVHINKIQTIFEDVSLNDHSMSSYDRSNSNDTMYNHSPENIRFQLTIGRGLIENFRRRAKYYISDYEDGLFGDRTALKVSGATLSLFFAIILPCVAFGVVNEHETNGLIGPTQALIGQAIGGLLFAILSGQPLVIIATTAPLCLFTNIVYQYSTTLEVDFLDLFAMVGLWNAFFLIVYSVFDMSTLMRFCTRSTEEIFATFIFFAFSIDAFKQCATSFREHYYCSDLAKITNNTNFLNNFYNGSLVTITNITPNGNELEDIFRNVDYADCSPARSILFLFLMFGTLTLGLLLYNFGSTAYLMPVIRETISDYSLPVAVVVFSFLSSVVFQSIDADSFHVTKSIKLSVASLSSLTPLSILLSMILGFQLSILFFIDQNVSAALVNTPMNKLQKGDAYHWDLLIVAILNIFLSIFGLPWMHGILPHSPMHAQALADTITLNTPTGTHTVVQRVRETRVSGILIHLLIGIVVLLIPQLFDWIPTAVLSGLFLYCAVSTLRNNSFFERLLLIFTQQKSYPPTHYLRYCSQSTVHFFTMIQTLQLAIICAFGFAPNQFVQCAFPFIIALLIPIRWLLLPRLFPAQHLAIIDSKHC